MLASAKIVPAYHSTPWPCDCAAQSNQVPPMCFAGYVGKEQLYLVCARYKCVLDIQMVGPLVPHSEVSMIVTCSLACTASTSKNDVD